MEKDMERQHLVFEVASLQEEVSAVMQITRERVRQIQMNALKRLKRILEQEGGSRELFLQSS